MYAKTELFETGLQTSAELYKALSHPARLAILKYLAESRTCITGDFAGEIPLSRTTVSQHLKELKDAGLITCKIEGVKTFYCLNLSRIMELSSVSAEFFKNIIASDPMCSK
jgi:ArsR family transcriptional regulator